MADRYWVGGTGTWTLSGTTNWSDSSGGASGFSAPTSADNTFFDGGSGGGIVTISGTRSCADLNCTGFTGTITGSGTPIIDFYGSVLLSATMTIDSTVGPFFRKFGGTTGTFTSAGKTIRNFELSSASTVSLSDAIVSANAITITQGTFTTNGYSVTASSLSSSNTNTRTINLSSSTVALTVIGSAPVSINPVTGLVWDAGSSTVIIPSATGFAGSGLTWYNVSFTSTASNSIAVTGANTFNNFAVTGRSSIGTNLVSFNASQTINGTLTISSGTTATMRSVVRSSSIGIPRTLTCNTVSTLIDVDFRDITIAGNAVSSGNLTGVRLGDCGGNTGITFDAAKTVYWRATSSANWGSTSSSWSSTPGGTADHTAFPLAQDTVIFPAATYPAAGSTATINAAYNIGTIDMSARTSNAMTLTTVSVAPTIYGNWINGTGITLSGLSSIIFAGRNGQTITSAGKTFTQAITISTPGSSLTLQDAFITNNTAGSTPISITTGTLNLNNYNLTQSGNAPGGISISANREDASIIMGAGNITLAGSGSIVFNNFSGCSVTGTGTISLTSNSSKIFRGGGFQNYPTINQGSTSTLTITGSNKFADITNTAIGRIQFTGGTTNRFTNFSINGISGNLLQLGSDSTSTAILRKATAWNVGANSTDAGNNIGLSFTAGDNNYLSISYIDGRPNTTLYIGTSSISSIYYGSTAVSAIYYGSTQVF